ncbi:MAG: hypothetical protein DRP66_05325 [Planctomycetota bacterium]|nr:MAG: hypothetical protein DRP66_05325 [Planctomycetota bacterium]
MGRSKNKSKRAGQKRRGRDREISTDMVCDPAAIAEKQKYLNIFIILLLLVFGTYLSILYFGHQTVPNSDFPAFVQTGRDFLAFVSSFGEKEIGSFKRVPGLGVLQVGLSHLVGGRHPDLTAGWLLNAILFPPTIILLYLLGREILGKSAVWFALLVAINPWSLNLLRDPIVETTLVFFSVLALYSIFKRWRCRYFLAAAATMIRYEGAALILAAFLMDIIEARSWPKRIAAAAYSALAGLPMALWLMGMYNEQGQGGGVNAMHYVRNYSTGRERVVGQFAEQLRQVGIGSFFAVTTKSSFEIVTGISQCVLVICLVLAVVYMVYKKQWKVSAPLSMLISCFFVHAMRTNTRTRYAMPMGWLVLLLCLYGLVGGLRLLSQNKRFTAPKPIVVTLQIILLIGSIVWLCVLAPYLPKLGQISSRSVSVAYAGIGVVIAVTIGGIFVCKTRFGLGRVAVAVLLCLMIVSNQFSLARVVGNGDRDREFKLLADWYVANAKPGEKLVTTMGQVVRIYAPKYAGGFVRTESIAGDDREGFVEDCYKKNITYVAWDSRLGLSRGNTYYRRYGLDRIAALQGGRDTGPYRFLTTLTVNSRRYIHVYRLEKKAPSQNRPM